jgi:hypothetical protein
MQLSEKINQFNHSKKAQAWVFTIVNYIFCYMIITGNNPVGDAPLSVLGYLFIPSAIYLTYLHIKSWVTGQDVWQKVDFDLIGGEEELHESETTKKLKSILTKALIVGIVLFFLTAIIFGVIAFVGLSEL